MLDIDDLMPVLQASKKIPVYLRDEQPEVVIPELPTGCYDCRHDAASMSADTSYGNFELYGYEPEVGDMYPIVAFTMGLTDRYARNARESTRRNWVRSAMSDMNYPIMFDVDELLEGDREYLNPYVRKYRLWNGVPQHVNGRYDITQHLEDARHEIIGGEVFVVCTYKRMEGLYVEPDWYYDNPELGAWDEDNILRHVRGHEAYGAQVNFQRAYRVFTSEDYPTAEPYRRLELV